MYSFYMSSVLSGPNLLPDLAEDVASSNYYCICCEMSLSALSFCWNGNL